MSRGSTIGRAKRATGLTGLRNSLPPIEGAPAAPPTGALGEFFSKRVSITSTAQHQSAQNIQKSLASVKIFKDMDPTVLKMLPEIVVSIFCKAGTVLFKQGDPPGSCYVIISGSVGIFGLSDEEGTQASEKQHANKFSSICDSSGFLQDFLPGQKTVDGFSRYHDDTPIGNRLSKLSAGSVLGELALMNDQPRLASAMCLEDTEFFVIRRNDFDNILKEEMVKKGDEKLRFLMLHLPGMKDVPVPKPGGKPHTSYIFKHGRFPRGHTFLCQGKMSEPHLWAVYRGAVEFRRAEVLSMERLERIGGRLEALGDEKNRAKSLRPLSAFKKGAKGLSLSASAPHGIGRDGNVALEANDCNPHGVMSRRGVLVRGGVFGSLPFPAPEPFTVRVTSPMCEVFFITSADYSKLPRKLLDVLQDYVASSTTWRLSCHQKSTNFRRAGRRTRGEELSLSDAEDRREDHEHAIETGVDVSELLEECREERKLQFESFCAAFGA